MRTLYSREASADSSRRGSVASLSLVINPLHSKYKGIISTPGFCKFSAWKREAEIPKLWFSSFILQQLSSAPKEKIWMKDISTGRSVTFGDAIECVGNIKIGFAKYGLKAGCTVCMWTTNYVEYWLAGLAAWELGAAVMPVNCLVSADKLEHQLNETLTMFLVCDEMNVDDAIALKHKVPSLSEVFIIEQEEILDKNDNVRSIRTLLSTKGDVDVSPPTVSWDKDPIYFLWAKVDGKPALVQHTNKSLLAQIYSPSGTSNHWFDQIQGDIVLGACWFFHISGLYSFSLSALNCTTLYVLSDYSDENLLQGVSENSISSVILYPWQIRMLCHSPLVQKFDLSQLRLVITGGTLLAPFVKLELLEKHPYIKYIRESYGMKEAGFITYTYPKDRSKQIMSKVDVSDHHHMPVGLPNMWTVLKIVDRVSGQPVSGPDIQGELCVKSCQLMRGYKSMDRKSFDSDGFFHTGDLGYYDKDGFIYFIEKIEDLITFWMYEVTPNVLESRLLSHPSVSDAAVIGINDKENGQIPRGFVVLKNGHEETEENLTNYLESRLQDHERIRGGLYYVEKIPRDENGKVIRRILEEFLPPPKREGELGPCPASLLSATDDALQDMYGMRSRSRRGSKDDLLEDKRLDPDTEVSPDQEKDEELEYLVEVKVSSRYLRSLLLEHPNLEDAEVRVVHVEGFGQAPRAHVVLKPGVSISEEDLAIWANSRLDWQHRLMGGIKIADILPLEEDSVGKDDVED